MALTFNPAEATAILYAHGGGWEAIQQGSLKIDELELIPASPTAESEDYGFSCVDSTGYTATGRLSALLAVRTPPVPQQQPA